MFKKIFILLGVNILLCSCSALSALSALTGTHSNSGTQVKAHAKIGDNKNQAQGVLSGNAIKDNRGGVVTGKDLSTYHAKTVTIKNENGMSYKEILLIFGIIILVIIAHRIPWKFWKRKNG